MLEYIRIHDSMHTVVITIPGVLNSVAGGNVVSSLFSNSAIMLTRRNGGLKSTCHGVVPGSSLGEYSTM